MWLEDWVFFMSESNIRTVKFPKPKAVKIKRK